MNIVFGGSEASSAHFKSGEVEHSASDLFTVPPSYFRVDLILKKTDGGNLADASQSWLAPNAFHTIIKQPSIYVNGTLTTEQTDTYAYSRVLLSSKLSTS